MKLRSKKGFTIVELVIVIAVIAILAAVLIPTFSTVIKNAQKSSAMQSAKAAYIEAYAAALEDGFIDADGETKTSGGFTFKFKADGTVEDVSYSGTDNLANWTYSYNNTNGTITVSGK